VLLPWHPGSGSRSSTQKPVPDSCPLYAGRRPSSLQAPDGLIPVVWTAPGFDDTYGYRRVLEGLLSLSFRTPTCPESCPGLSFRRSPPRLFAAAARTGLRPALKADPDGPTIISCAASRHGSVPLELLPCLCGTRPQGPQALGSNGASRLWTLWATRLPWLSTQWLPSFILWWFTTILARDQAVLKSEGRVHPITIPLSFAGQLRLSLSGTTALHAAGWAVPVADCFLPHRPTK